MGLNAAFGPPGVMAIIMITSTNGLGTGITIYVITLGVAYISGFFATLLGYRIFKNSSKIQ
jgi:N-acetylmuramic acid-specific PTS system IIC component